MKLVVDVAAQRVVFAEAGKDVVDFLFSLLALPLARVAKLVADTGSGEELGAVGNLRGSVAAMDPAYVQPGAARESLLSPVVLSPPAHITNSFHSLKRKLYTCGGIYSTRCGTFVTDGKGAPCPSCGDGMTTVTRYVPPGTRRGVGGAVPPPASVLGESAGGFVRGGPTYVVMDDLTVVPTPASAVSNVEMLTSALGALSVGRNPADLRVKSVMFGAEEGREILKASLQSKTVLTDVFLRRMQI
ncbi:hypothetical protein QOZ80_1BG0058700 [Eleusine coracana subsp. coracana]|nr:hypothetical protein QOZ80_1BG0058700 [Eleusine coracana subsp. coracana]